MTDSVSLFKALADETRLHILLLLLKHDELCVCEFMEALDEHQPKISRHLSLLRKLDLVASRRDAQWIHYRLKGDLPQWMVAILESALVAEKTRLKKALTNLKKLKARVDFCK